MLMERGGVIWNFGKIRKCSPSWFEVFVGIVHFPDIFFQFLYSWWKKVGGGAGEGWIYIHLQFALVLNQTDLISLGLDSRFGGKFLLEGTGQGGGLTEIYVKSESDHS